MSIKYLSGAPREGLTENGIGLILTPMMGNRASHTDAAQGGADNGCFKHPEKFNLKSYLNWIKARNTTTCLFATAPDVVGDAAKTLERSEPVLPLLRQLGVPAALVAQDGLENLEIPWHSFDCLFIGGSTEWKLSPAAANLAREAKSRGKWVHMGRVNSYKRLKYAQEIGCDSADGTYLAFAPTTNLAKLIGWLKALATTPTQQTFEEAFAIAG